MKISKLSCIGLLFLVFFSFSIFIESNPVAATSIGEWKFDEGTGLLANDSSGRGKTGRLWGAVQWVDGIINKALQFNGSTDYVQVAPSIQDLTSWSFTAYVKPTGNQGAEQYVYSERDVNGDVYFYICLTSDRRVKVATRHHLRAGQLNNHSAWDIYQTDKNVITSGDWNYLMITFNGGSITPDTGTVKCYINGRKVGEGKLGPSTKTPLDVKF